MFRSLIVVATLAISSMAFAAPAATSGSVSVLPEGTKGIGFAFPTGGGGEIIGTYFLSSSNAVAFKAGIDLNKQNNVDATFGWSLDAAYRMYHVKSGPVAAYCAPSVFIARASAASALVNWGPSFSIGADYFFNNNLSFGVSTGVNFTIGGAFDSFRVNTGTTALNGTLYF